MKIVQDDIVGYREMCDRENAQVLQRGMNFHFNGGDSILLMSLRKNAPYNDRIEDDGRILIYEGHDIPKTKEIDDPKRYDQPLKTPTGKLTQNGLFHQAAQRYRGGEGEAELVRVYQKLFD
ncbi:HNH endonuclease, partial [bacterium]|nr:HNH endonuclease [bacterium]